MDQNTHFESALDMSIARPKKTMKGHGPQSACDTETYTGSGQRRARVPKVAWVRFCKTLMRGFPSRSLPRAKPKGSGRAASPTVASRKGLRKSGRPVPVFVDPCVSNMQRQNVEFDASRCQQQRLPLLPRPRSYAPGLGLVMTKYVEGGFELKLTEIR